MKSYQDLYNLSIEQNDQFWREQGLRLDWFKPYTSVLEGDFFQNDKPVQWFADGELNVCYNCIDRHLKDRADHTAILFESDDLQITQKVTFQELHTQVSKCANALKSLGVSKGDRVLLYMPMIIEASVVMLACARIGAVHCVVFGGFSPESLASRIENAEPKVIITVDKAKRGGKSIDFLANVKKALDLSEQVQPENIIVLQSDIYSLKEEYAFFDYHDLMRGQSTDCPCESMNAEDPLFILYTSGSTGQPKGLVHTTGGYLVYASITHEYVFDIDMSNYEETVYWCTADIGWITGHSYVVYGPLANGITTLMFEGVPTYPDASCYWKIIDKHKVNVLYTAPTVLRTLKSLGDTPLHSTTRGSLKVLGTVGESIDPTTWHWYADKIGNKKAYVVDTWWQTETGGHMIAPIARYREDAKAGSVSKPFFGIQPVLLDHEGYIVQGSGRGNLCISKPWPGMGRTLYKDHKRFVETYLKVFPGYYCSGDGSERDEDGYYWITGRTDDVVNVSGHRLGTNELETALTKHPKVAEAAVVGFPHDIKGQGLYAYVVLYNDDQKNDELKKELISFVRTAIGPIATIDSIQWSKGLPKTRSGKIMRRILRKIAEGVYEELGDTSTLADEDVLIEIINGHRQ